MTAEPIPLHSHPRSRYTREHRAQGNAAVPMYGGVKPARRALEAPWGADPSAPDDVPSTSTLRAWRDDPTIEADREWIARIQREFALAQHGIIARLLAPATARLERELEHGTAQDARHAAESWKTVVDRLEPRR